MRIAFLTREYPTEKNFASGMATYVRRTARALNDVGHEAEVFTLSHVAGQIEHEAVLVHRVETGTLHERISGGRYFWRFGGYASTLLPAWKLAAALRRRHREAPFDIVQSVSSSACGVVAAFWKVAPLVTRISSYEPLWRRGEARAAVANTDSQVEWVEALQRRWSSAVYAPSKLLADTVSATEELPVSVIEPPFYLDELSSPIDTSPAAESAADSYALFFGIIGPIKGCDRLVRVLPELLERNREMKFIFVGRLVEDENGQTFDRTIREKLERYKDRVTVLPAQKPAVVMRLVQNARFVVLPSKIDNLPNTCMEAMAFNRVVIGTHHASFDQLIEDGVNGFLVSQEDDAELAACMNKVWRMDEAERVRMGARAAASLERMRPQKAVEQLVEFFDEVIARTKDGKGENKLNHAVKVN